MRNNIFIAIIINVFITLTEVIIGFFIGSLALISDAVHNFFDVGTLGLTWWGEKIKKKSPNKQKTYGYKRAEIIIALFNSLVLLAVVIFIFIEAMGRLFNPAEITGYSMIIMAFIALVGNGIATYLLEKDSHKNLNLKSAWLHSLQDALFSLGVVAGAIIIRYTGWFILDPILSIFLSLYIFKEVYNIIRQTVNILMESIPEDVDFQEVKNTLINFGEVKNANDMHIWQTDSNSRFLSVHLEIENLDNEKRNELLCSIQKKLDEEFKINHSTIQMISASEQEKLKFNCNHCN
jgi:cobalt-zinc-cadmium efflux system protein